MCRCDVCLRARKFGDGVAIGVRWSELSMCVWYLGHAARHAANRTLRITISISPRLPPHPAPRRVPVGCISTPFKRVTNPKDDSRFSLESRTRPTRERPSGCVAIAQAARSRPRPSQLHHLPSRTRPARAQKSSPAGLAWTAHGDNALWALHGSS
jgi:hypothetical protein